MSSNTDVPYFSQWESREHVLDFIEGRLASHDDPQWRRSGAPSVEAYAQWANQVCGLACLKMILAFKTGVVHDLFSLLAKARAYGAYVVEQDSIRGLIYAPFVKMLDKEFGIHAQVVTGITAAQVHPLRSDGRFFMASVHPSIRWPEREPAIKGGHLVLVTGSDEEQLTFHNPSGHDRETQENACVAVDTFERFFAGRGVLI